MPKTIAVAPTTPAHALGKGGVKSGKTASGLATEKIARAEAQKVMHQKVMQAARPTWRPRNRFSQEMTPEETAQEPAPEPAPLSRAELLGHRVALMNCESSAAAPPRLGWRSLSLRMATSWRTLAQASDDAPPPGLEHLGGITESTDAATNKEKACFAPKLDVLMFRDDDEDAREQERGVAAAALCVTGGESRDCVAAPQDGSGRGSGVQEVVLVDLHNTPPPASAIAGAWHDSLGNEIQVPLGEHDHVACAFITGRRGTKKLHIELDQWGLLHCGNGVLCQVGYASEDAPRRCLDRLFWRTSDWRTSTWERTGVPPPGKGGLAAPGQQAQGRDGSNGEGGEQQREQGRVASGWSKGKGRGKGGEKQQWRKRL